MPSPPVPTRTSRWSLWSDHSVLSVASSNSVLSIGSVGSVASVGSAGSVLSVASVGSAVAIGCALAGLSRWSVLSWRSVQGSLNSGYRP